MPDQFRTQLYPRGFPPALPYLYGTPQALLTSPEIDHMF